MIEENKINGFSNNSLDTKLIANTNFETELKRSSKLNNSNISSRSRSHYSIIQEGQDIINNNLTKYAIMNESELFQALNSDMNGLSDNQVLENRKKFGVNEIKKGRTISWYYHLWLSFANPFNLLLTLLCIISYLTDDMKGTIVIGSMVVISTFISFITERRSRNAAEKLKKMITTNITVYRQDPNQSDLRKAIDLPIKDLVPGDIISLSSGVLVPADVRILNSINLFVSQTALTGESMPVKKLNKRRLGENVLDLQNIAFMGTNVSSGTGKAIVIATGKDTMFGDLADKVVNQSTTITEFQKGIRKVTRLLIIFMLIMSPIVFVINGIVKQDWAGAALFALAIAVGLTPEMLPLVVTSTMSKGAILMSSKKVIVKRLDAISNFGALNILCTDKTGTLTQDKICLEKYVDISGNQYKNSLKYGYLNSFYQTGLKNNPLDLAIIEKGKDLDNDFLNIYHMVYEIPFDFERRRMSVILKDNEGSILLVCKGAVEETLKNCSAVVENQREVAINETIIKNIQGTANNLHSQGFKVLAVAIKEFEKFQNNFEVIDERQMVLIGFLAFLDLPKDTAKQSIESLKLLGIEVKVLTGDNELVTKEVCKEVGLNYDNILLGHQIDDMDDEELYKQSLNICVFAKLTPAHKERIVKALQDKENVVGFLGDGINDAPALRAADIGISVDSAVDLAKGESEIILMEKDLTVLEKGVVEGRKTFSNMLKYTKMTASSNFGNVFSVLVASGFLPFEPMKPMHFLITNLLYDISQIAIPFDNVDPEFIATPQRWNIKDLYRFMLFFGPLSSIFDIVTFIILWYYFEANNDSMKTFFQSGWFVESICTQTLIIHMIRTKKIPFIQSIAGWPLIMMTTLIVAFGIFLPLSPFASTFELQSLPLIFFAWLAGIVLAYILLVQSMKSVYVKLFGWQ